MKFFITIVAAVFLLFFWLSGFVVAKGFWSTLLSKLPTSTEPPFHHQV